MENDKSWALTASIRSLKEDPVTASLMLRLGAAVNAIRASQRLALAAREFPGLAGIRDLTWAFLLATAQLKEAVDGLLNPNFKLIIALAEKGGASRESILALGDLQSTKPQSLYSRVLKDTRNLLAFHWEAAPFQEWALRATEDPVFWTTGIDDTEGNVVHHASARAILESLAPGASEAEIRKRAKEVSDGTKLISDIFQLAIVGYLADYDGKMIQNPPEASSGMKRYLRIVPAVSSSIRERYVAEIKDSIEWVDSPDEATADYRTAIEVTQQKLKQQLGLETKLVEIPEPRQMESKWVISKEDS